MKCIIPVHQERYPEHALERADKICTEIEILYIVDEKIMKKFREESAYILSESAIDDLENYIIEMQHETAKKLASEHNAELKFVVSEYYEAIEAEILRNKPDIILTDFFIRRFFRYPVPIWIDRGEKISEITFVIDKVALINKLMTQINFLKDISSPLNSSLCLRPADEETKKVIEGMNIKLCEKESNTLAVQRDSANKFHKWEGNLIVL